MDKINFKNLPDETTPINASNLNKMQDNIEADIQPLKENILSNNLFDGKLLTDKSRNMNSGAVGTYAGYNTTENILIVQPNKNIIVSNNGKAVYCRILFFDSNGAFLNSIIHDKKSVTVPENAKYFAFNVASSELTSTKIMINYGTEPIEYEKYINAIAELEAEIGTKISKNATYNGIDINTINDTETGSFNITCTNTPFSDAGGYLETIKMSENYAMQIATHAFDGTEHKRLKIGGTWGNWACAGGQVLWTNPNPTAEFLAQEITLSSSDYKYLKFYFKNGSSCIYAEAMKGYGVAAVSFVGEGSGATIGMRRRHLNYVDDTTYSVGEGQLKYVNVNTAAQIFGTILIPLQIIGYN